MARLASGAAGRRAVYCLSAAAPAPGAFRDCPAARRDFAVIFLLASAAGSSAAVGVWPDRRRRVGVTKRPPLLERGLDGSCRPEGRWV